jgi:hypothetical protein
MNLSTNSKIEMYGRIFRANQEPPKPKLLPTRIWGWLRLKGIIKKGYWEKVKRLV